MWKRYSRFVLFMDYTTVLVDTTITAIQEFSHEAVVWRQLSHPNLLPFYGIYRSNNGCRVCLLSPWMDNGTIVQFLKKNPDVYRPGLVSNRPGLLQRVGDHTCCYFQVWDVANGLKYLHTMKPAIIHGDLKGVGQSKCITMVMSEFDLGQYSSHSIISRMSRRFWPSYCC
jgi:serine/threonine protein kinase